MGSEGKVWQNSKVTKLQILAFTAMESPDRSGMLTPPIHASVSVPFGWEEKPGKPRFCFNNNNTPTTQRKCLELPPRLLLMDPKIPKLPPPLPITPQSQKGMFQLPNHCCASFRFDKKQLGAMVLRKRGVLTDKDWFCWLRKGSFGMCFSFFGESSWHCCTHKQFKLEHTERRELFFLSSPSQD